MRQVHIVGLPHTPFDAEEASLCAFTAKTVRTAKMLRSRGIPCTVYWGGDKADVSLMSVDEQTHHFGEYDPSILPVLDWDWKLGYWKSFNGRAISEISKRIQPGDIVAVVGGAVSQEVVDHFHPDYTCIEPGVGYGGICQNTFCCFESYAWMHDRYGAYGIINGRSFDAVIPNAVDPDDWYMDESDGYLLSVGRMIARKGHHFAAQLSERMGIPLKLAGAGVVHNEPGFIRFEDGTEIRGDHVEYVGAVRGEERKSLFARAEWFICPTIYIEPWGGVHVEAMMSGLPTIAPDYGAFTGTLPRRHRYRDAREAEAALLAPDMPRGQEWRDLAIDICGIEKCADMYAEWIDRLDSIRDGRGGFYRI